MTNTKSKASELAMRFGFVSVAVFACLFGCENPERTEAESLIQAVSRFRLSKDADRRSFVKAIEDTKATVKEIADAKAECLNAARTVTNGEAMIASIEADNKKIPVDAGAEADSERERLLSKLDEASAALKSGKELNEKCESLLSPLRAKYRR